MVFEVGDHLHNNNVSVDVSLNVQFFPASLGFASCKIKVRVQKHTLYKKQKYRRRRPRLVYVGAVRLAKR